MKCLLKFSPFIPVKKKKKPTKPFPSHKLVNMSLVKLVNMISLLVNYLCCSVWVLHLISLVVFSFFPSFSYSQSYQWNKRYSFISIKVKKKKKKRFPYCFFFFIPLFVSLAPWRTGAEHRFKHSIVVTFGCLINLKRTLHCLVPFYPVSIIYSLYIYIPHSAAFYLFLWVIPNLLMLIQRYDGNVLYIF